MKAVSAFVASVLLLGIAVPRLGAQSVAINIDGSDANANAILDVVSPPTGSGKGLLAPRITQAQRTTADASLAGGLLDGSGNLRGGAAQGLLVYQTDGTQGFYYNSSTTSTPSWVYLGSGSGTITSITASSPLTGGTISSSGTIGIPKADASKDGYLDNADFANFDAARQAADAATNENTASTLVKRDGSGNFSAGTVTANLTGNVTGNVTGDVTGNADTATSLVDTLPVEKGGTGATTAGSARVSLGLESMATQEANAIAVTGGTVDGAVIGGTTPAAGTFTDAKVGDTNAYYLGLNKALHKGSGAMTGNLVVGDGGGSLSHLAGYQGWYNTFLGLFAGNSCTTGYYNTLCGYQAMRSGTAGYGNTALGANTLRQNTAGSQNVAIGFSALFANLNDNNTAVGNYALVGNIGGSKNVAIGNNTLFSATDGIENIAVGYGAAETITTGSGNILVGSGADVKNATDSNSIVIGKGATGNGSNSVTIGSANVTDTYFHGALRIGETKVIHRGQGNFDGNLVVGDGGGALVDGDMGDPIARYNTFIGLGSGEEATSGYGNTATGYQALNANQTGVGNVAIGYKSLYSNTGAYNVGMGASALQSNSSGAGNIAIGFQALISNTEADYNVGIGHEALRTNTTGDSNIAIGYRALYQNTEGTDNVAVGRSALFSNSISMDVAGQGNTAVGSSALQANERGRWNTGVGFHVLESNTTAFYNTAVGTNALHSVSTSNGNTAVGYQAGYNLTGENNVCIGYEADVKGATDSNSIVIGAGAAGKGDGTITVGSDSSNSGTYIYGIEGKDVGIGGVAVYINADHQLGTLTSSRRYKKEIDYEGVDGAKLYALQPVAFQYKDSDDSEHVGFIAEDVHEVEPRLVVYRDGVPETVRYPEFSALIVQAVKELKAEKDEEIAQLKARIEKLEAMLGE